MQFNTLTYFIFFFMIFAIYWMVDYLLSKYEKQDDSNMLIRNAVLLMGSYIFYAWWNWRFLGLLFGMSLLSWGVGNLLMNNKRIEQNVTIKKSIIGVVVVVDILILGFFKYYNFFVDSFCSLFALSPQHSTLNMILPLGISFFTFQSISYVVDAYRGKLPHTDEDSNIQTLVECLLYIGFFPKLLAGPIERPNNMIPQIQHRRIFTYEQGVDGVRQFVWGLFKKMVIADNCATYVDAVWSDIGSQSGSTLLLAAILYTIQIYGDFSGYSDMALGSAKLLGFRFRDNFLFPYFSRNMGEFWKRWHISLNTWFVDYVYTPLGGSRNGKARTIANTMIIFLLSGLWHGADWSFVAWGGYHGLLLVLLIIFGWNTKYEKVVAYDRLLPSVKELAQMMLVFILSTIGWILFRAFGMTQFWQFFTQMLSPSLFSMPDISGLGFALLHIILMFVIEWCMRRNRHGMDTSNVSSAIVRYALYILVLFDIYFFGGHTENFIYMYF